MEAPETDTNTQKPTDEQQEPANSTTPNESYKFYYDQVSDIAVKVAETQGKIKKNIADKRQYTYISLFFIAAAIATYFYRAFLNSKADITWFVAVFISLAILIAIAAFGAQGNISTLQSDIDIFNVRLRIANLFAGNAQESTNSYFDSLVQINVENLASYYALVKIHTDKSFLVSIVAGAIGFILITAGLVVGFFAPTGTHVIAYITSASGILTELISSVFFYLYNRTVRQMKEYHDSLLVVQNILLSFKLVEDTKDEAEKAKMVSQMLGYLVSKQGGVVLPDPSVNKL